MKYNRLKKIKSLRSLHVSYLENSANFRLNVDLFNHFSKQLANILQISWRCVLKIEQILCRTKFSQNFTDFLNPENAANSYYRKSEENREKEKKKVRFELDEFKQLGQKSVLTQS